MDSEEIIFVFSRAFTSLVAKVVCRYTDPVKGDVLHQAEGFNRVKLG